MDRQKVLRYFFLIFLSFCAGIAGAISLYKVYIAPQMADLWYKNNGPEYYPARAAAFRPEPYPGGAVSFVKASEVARPCVVYIKVQSEQRVQSFFWDPFGTMGQVSSSGSGVIISSDGYIVTNSHVVKNAQKIEIIFNNNKKSFTGKVVGFDASSDLALVKISASGLPYPYWRLGTGGWQSIQPYVLSYRRHREC